MKQKSMCRKIEYFLNAVLYCLWKMDCKRENLLY